MKKVLVGIVLLITSVAFIISSSPKLMKKVTDKRFYMKSIFASDRYAHGDLYGLSFLSAFKENKNKEIFIRFDSVNTNPREINLYTICDSYMNNYIFNEKWFNRVKKYTFARWGPHEGITVELDTTQLNVLLIETVERSLRFFADSNYVLTKMHVEGHQRSKKTEQAASALSRMYSFLKVYKYNPLINQNLEFNLFDYRFLSPLKEVKADMNYYLFNRVSYDVAISPDNQYLFIGGTVDSNDNSSSFKTFSQKRVDEIVAAMNAVQRHYKKRGFDAVYFAFIPNPVTVLYPNMGTYNQLIPRLQNHPKREFPVYDVYEKFRTCKVPLYRTNDSHWNANGMHLWLNGLNAELDSFYVHSPKAAHLRTPE